MPRSALTGSRIRARRMALGLRQADLARTLGVSASYLNLIEHNRRRAAPQLIDAAAAALAIPARDLAEGAGASFLDGLRDAAAQAAGDGVAEPGGLDTPPELDRAEEFVGRFPGWAALVAAQARRLVALERTVTRLSDRMAHDPQLSESLHEVLSAASSVQSTAAILAETEDVPPDWQARFHRNLHADSRRLAEGAQALVAYLDTVSEEETALAAPQEELEAWLAARGYHLPGVEPGTAEPDAALLDGAAELASGAARQMAARHLRRARADAAALPAVRLAAAVAAEGPDPARLGHRLGLPPALVFRRLAALPPDTPGLPPVGLVICDGSGTLVFRRPLDGFDLPRFGAACPLWPLYQALVRPMMPVAARLQMGGRFARRFRAWAVCEAAQATDFGQPPVLEAVMLLMPDDGRAESERGAPAVVEVGSTCRLCARPACPARREPSILGEAAAEGF